MAFKENLLKKIDIDRKREAVLNSLGAGGDSVRIDKDAMKYLLQNAGMRQMRMRNLDLYMPEEATDPDRGMILVLDNELGIYNTTLNDLLVRKEPTLKEMISIRNAIRILNDSDVIVSKKKDSLESVYQRCLERVDITFTEDDIRALEHEGRAAVEWKDEPVIRESLMLFGELLGYEPVPSRLRIENREITGKTMVNDKGETVYSPLIIYNAEDDSLKLMTQPVTVKDKTSLEGLGAIARNEKEPEMSGPDVIQFLSKEVLKISVNK